MICNYNYHRRIHSGTLSRAASLVEVLIAATIAFIVGVASLSIVTQGIYWQQMARERDFAGRLAAMEIERARRTAFPALLPTTQDMVLDDRGTEATTDDVPASVKLELYDTAGNILTAAPTDRSMIEARVTVSWNTVGKKQLQEKQKSLIVRTLLTP